MRILLVECCGDRVLKGIIRAGVKIRSVNRLGGRREVIKACKLDQKNDGRRKIYIIDADLDHIRGISKPRLKFLYRLRGYCVENIIIRQSAVVNLAEISGSNIDPSNIPSIVSFRKWMSGIEFKLRPLYICYGMAAECYMQNKTVSYSLKTMLVSAEGKASLCSKKISARMRLLWRDMRKSKSVAELKVLRSEIEKRAKTLDGSMYISGKDALLPLLRIHLRSCVSYNGTDDQLKAHLASLFEPSFEPYLAKRLRAL